MTADIFMAATNITLSHSRFSTGPAFSVDLFGKLSNALLLSNYALEASRNIFVMSDLNINSSLLGAQVDVFPLEAEMNLMLMVQIDLNAIEEIVNDKITANYFTIKQEGIGLEV